MVRSRHHRQRALLRGRRRCYSVPLSIETVLEKSKVLLLLIVVVAGRLISAPHDRLPYAGVGLCNEIGRRLGRVGRPAAAARLEILHRSQLLVDRGAVVRHLSGNLFCPDSRQVSSVLIFITPACVLGIATKKSTGKRSKKCKCVCALTGLG